MIEAPNCRLLPGFRHIVKFWRLIATHQSAVIDIIWAVMLVTAILATPNNWLRFCLVLLVVGLLVLHSRD
jgi:hypothetical protein